MIFQVKDIPSRGYSQLYLSLHHQYLSLLSSVLSTILNLLHLHTYTCILPTITPKQLWTPSSHTATPPSRIPSQIVLDLTGWARSLLTGREDCSYSRIKVPLCLGTVHSPPGSITHVYHVRYTFLSRHVPRADPVKFPVKLPVKWTGVVNT